MTTSRLYKTIAKAGDWVYAPVGALRATRVIGEEPIVAARLLLRPCAQKRLLRDFAQHAATMTHRLAPSGADVATAPRPRAGPRSDGPRLLCLDIAGAGRRVGAGRAAAVVRADAIFNAGAHPPACAVESLLARVPGGNRGARRRATALRAEAAGLRRHRLKWRPTRSRQGRGRRAAAPS